MGIVRPSGMKKSFKPSGKGGGQAKGGFQPSRSNYGVFQPRFGGNIGFGGGKGKGGKGGKGGNGSKGGGGAGQWVFMPAAASVPNFVSHRVIQPQFRKGGVAGKSFGKGGKSFGKGGKGKQENKYKFMDKLDTIDAERKVWVGGLPKDCTRGNIVEHFKAVANPSVFEIMSKGTACISFKTAEDAETVISALNDSELGGKTIQVDVWTKKEKKVRPEGEKREKKTKLKLKTSLLKNKTKPGNEKMKLKIKAVDHSLKVWVGGLSTETTWKLLKQHFVDNGLEADLCDLMKPGTACVTFKTEDDASNAVASINGTELDSNTLEVDVWQRPEKKEKKKKAED